MKKQPWLASAIYDGLWILSPPLIATFAVAAVWLLNPEIFSRPMSPWLWFVLVLSIDVSHVYASIYRTILKPEVWQEMPWLFTVVPLLVYVAGYFLFQKDPLWFWRTLAYLAVFHFVRQPYGLMMLYKRGTTKEPMLWHRLDQIAIYTASLYPIACWHLDPSRAFSWFIGGDFIQWNAKAWQIILHVGAALVFGSYVCKEVYAFRNTRRFNLPKNLVWLGTAFSFGFGILFWNSDLAFTATNVISHGIAYLGLIWLTDARSYFQKNLSARISFVFPILFAFSLLVFALVEESLWDTLVWEDHPALFEPLAILIRNLGMDFTSAKTPTGLAFLVPLLALPQATHYVWDGFIWRRQRRKEPA